MNIHMRVSRVFSWLRKGDFDWLKWISNCVVFLSIVTFFGVLGFIIYRSIPVFEHVGLDFVVSDRWVPKENHFGIWSFIVSTFWAILLTIVLVVFLNLFVSITISKFLPSKVKNFVLFFVQFFSGVPSIVFGVFGAFVFTNFLQKLGVIQPQGMLMAVLILVIMILPTTVALTVNILDNVPRQYELSAYALGIDKVTVTFTIIKRICTKAILVVLFFAFCKAVGEVTAISLIAGNGPNKPPLDQGFAAFFFASITTLSSLIGLEIAENFSNLHESALFAVSAFLLFVVLIANLLLTFYFHLRFSSTFFKGKKFSLYRVLPDRFITSQFFAKFSFYWTKFVYWMRVFFMVCLPLLVGIIFFWILVDISWNGIIAFNLSYLIETTGDTGLLSVLLVTIILVVASLLFAVPLGFLIAVFLVYYGQGSWFLVKLNKFLTFFIYQFSSTPTIIFGMFGLAVFVSFFNLGFSILSTALTMVLIVLPVIVQTFRQNFESFSPFQYKSALALGLKKHKIILNLIMPATLSGLWIALILTVNRIIAESAPVLVTMGATVVFPHRGIFSGGRTLSSHIYLVGMEGTSVYSQGIVYQTAFLVLMLLFLLNLCVYFFQKQQKKFFRSQGYKYEQKK